MIHKFKFFDYEDEDDDEDDLSNTELLTSKHEIHHLSSVFCFLKPDTRHHYGLPHQRGVYPAFVSVCVLYFNPAAFAV